MTDHYDRAVDAIQRLPSTLPADEVLMLAQVHASLALSEQQRIANLIALNEQWEESEHPDWYAQPQRLRPEITRALRIETQ